MTRQTHLQAVFVEFIPDRLEPGKLYISQKYSTAAHLCCCNCGNEVVTPLNPAKWRLIECNGTVSLSPSIGNWSFPCQSHYWITDGQVNWVGALSPTRIEVVRNRDHHDAELYAETKTGNQSVRRHMWMLWEKFIRWIQRYL